MLCSASTTVVFLMLLGSPMPCSTISALQSLLFQFCCSFEGRQCGIPEPVQPLFERYYAVRIDAVNTTRPLDVHHHQTGGLHPLKVRGDGRAADVHPLGDLAH